MSDNFQRIGTPADEAQHSIHFRFSTEVFNALTFLSKETGESKRSLVHRAVIQHLHGAGFPHLVLPKPTRTTIKKEK